MILYYYVTELGNHVNHVIQQFSYLIFSTVDVIVGTLNLLIFPFSQDSEDNLMLYSSGLLGIKRNFIISYGHEHHKISVQLRGGTIITSILS